jgi:hypothetical protein
MASKRLSVEIAWLMERRIAKGRTVTRYGMWRTQLQKIECEKERDSERAKATHVLNRKSARVHTMAAEHY